MDNAVFDKYIKEMKEMSQKARLQDREAVPTANPQVKVTDENTGRGLLRVAVTSVRGLYPVQGAKVTVFRGKLEDMEKIAEGYTDESGNTELFLLSAPPSYLAQRENEPVLSYSEYNILTEADGFIPAVNYSLAVFDGVTSLQNVNLIPLTVFTENTPIVTDEENNYEL